MFQATWSIILFSETESAARKRQGKCVLCLVVTTVLGVDMEMFGAEAVALCGTQGQQLKGIWAANGRVERWSRGCMGVAAPLPCKQAQGRDMPSSAQRQGWGQG